MPIRKLVKRGVKAVKGSSARGVGMAVGKAASKAPGVKRTVQGAKKAPGDLRKAGSQVKAGLRKIRTEIGGTDAYQKALDERKNKRRQQQRRRG